jgi:proteic killer suppression protein
VILSFRHDGLKRFFETGSKAGIQPAHAERLRRQLTVLDASSIPADMGRPGWDLHLLKGNLKGHWSVRVNGNWRMTFLFEDGNAILVDCRDDH